MVQPKQDFRTEQLSLASILPTMSINSPKWRPPMKKSAFGFLGFALLFAIALPLQAQDGCTDSPENPTAILAVVGSAGALFAAARARIKANRRSSK
jgi:XrtJ-associated TM-motif-TM protein